MVTTADEVTVKFLGLTAGAEILGATQADFVVDRPHVHAKELSVLLNTPAAQFLAERLGVEDSPEFRAKAAEDVGMAWVRRRVEKGDPLDSITFLSKSALEADPEFVASLKA